MKKLICLVIAMLVTVAAYRAHAAESSVERLGVYVVASDMEKSRKFYEALFQKPPYINNDAFLGFDVAGGLYGVFATSAYATKVVKGNNTLPYIKVQNVEKEFERLKSLGVTMIDKSIVHDGPLKLFKFADPDGNIIELFAVDSKPAA